MQHSVAGTSFSLGKRGDALACIISTRCSQCDHSILLETSRKVKGPRVYRRWECNLAAVWGQMSTGGGHSKLQETIGVLGVPVMSARHFTNTERDIGEWWQKQLEEVAPKESHQISIPAIRTGTSPPLRWSLTSSWKDLNRLSRCMESDTRGLSGMETVPCIQH